MKSKIIYFSLFALSLGGIISCGDKISEAMQDKHIIPYVVVNTTIQLNLGGQDILSWKNNPKYFSTSTPDAKSLGYKGHGIIIYTENAEEFHCFDATCTNCPDLDSYFLQKDLKGSTAICPKCKTTFSLLWGQPFGNDTKIYPLKEYPTQKSGNKLIVSN